MEGGRTLPALDRERQKQDQGRPLPDRIAESSFAFGQVRRLDGLADVEPIF